MIPDKELQRDIAGLIYNKDPEAIIIIDRLCNCVDIQSEIPSDMIDLHWQLVYFPDEGGFQIDVKGVGVCTYELHPSAYAQLKKLIRKKKLQKILE
jgi:hypothetical protein